MSHPPSLNLIIKKSSAIFSFCWRDERLRGTTLLLAQYATRIR